jgi:hypothetical protein
MLKSRFKVNFQHLRATIGFNSEVPWTAVDAKLFLSFLVHFAHVRVNRWETQEMPREEDREKFVKLAQARVNKDLKDIQLITDQDISKIFRALNDEIGACKKRFELSKKKNGAAKFSLE